MTNNYIDMDMMLDLRNAIIERIGVDGLVLAVLKRYYMYDGVSDFVYACISDSDYKDVCKCLITHNYSVVLEYIEMFFGCDDITNLYTAILSDLYNLDDLSDYLD